METWIVLTLFALLAESLPSSVLAQDDLHAVKLGEQPRTSYTQRHLSPHRMMHFGKRPVVIGPPTIMAATPQVYDLLAERPQLQADRYPYLLSLDLERGQTLQGIPPELYSYGYTNDLINGHMQVRTPIYDLERPFGQSVSQLQGAKFNGGSGLKLQRLINSEPDSTNVISEPDQANQVSSNSSEDNQQQQTSSVSTRSGNGRISSMKIPTSFISTLLYGRPASSPVPAYGSFIKKSEPKDNFFMHFGRK